MYKRLHEFFSKTVPDTSLHEISDLIWAIKVFDVETIFTFTSVKKLTLQLKKHCNIQRPLPEHTQRL
jgi:hypothetical protein